MKRLLFYFSLIPLFLCSQDKIYTKDNVFMGYKEDLVDACVNGANDILNIGGNPVTIKDYCSCVMNGLIPKLYSWDIEQAAKNNTMKELFIKGENLDYIMDCIEPVMQSDALDDYNYGEQDYSDYDKSIMIKGCVEVAMSEEGIGSIHDLSYEDIFNYCSCSINKFVSLGYNFGQIKLIEDEGSEVFNEVTIPCMEEIFSLNESSSGYINSYVPTDIIGYKRSSKIDLVDYFNSLYKIKIDVGGIVKYFTFDTGASDLVISANLANDLIKKGLIEEDDFLGEELFTLADNSVVLAKMIRLDGVNIGDYTVNNVIVAVIEDGSLLCGVGFLNKFSNWELNQNTNSLILYK